MIALFKKKAFCWKEKRRLKYLSINKPFQLMPRLAVERLISFLLLACLLAFNFT